MARPQNPNVRVEQVSGNPVSGALAGSAAVFRPRRKPNVNTDRSSIAKAWQLDAYRHVNICGEARYAATLFAAIAGRAEIGVSEPQTIGRKAVWVESGPEVDVFAAVAPTVRDRSRLVRDYMLHRVIAGECYLIARERVDTDPGYEDAPSRGDIEAIDLMAPDFEAPERSGNPIWEIVSVAEIRKTGAGEDEVWSVRHDNGYYLPLSKDDPVIRLWTPDPSDRREAWSPFRSLLPTLREIEWLTRHIFAQVRSRLMSAGVWFVPDNLTFPPPPPDAVVGGAEAIAAMNEAEQLMMSLAASGMAMLDDDEVSFPSVVMGEPSAIASVDQNKLIQFWSEIDDRAMILRSDAVRRFSLGMDLPPEQVLGSSGLAVTGAGGSAGSVNHWGVWANEEQTISAHIEPALDDFVAALTDGILRTAIEGTDKVIGYDTATLRLRQDRSKEAMEWYERGELSGEVALRENGLDPDSDRMGDEEFRRWLLKRIAGGSATPEQMQSALASLAVVLPPIEPLTPPDGGASPQVPGQNDTPSLKDHPYEGPPREDHEHNDAPFSAREASLEALVLRALEKHGNRVLNTGKRGRDKDRETPAHLAHVLVADASPVAHGGFDFSLAPLALEGTSALESAKLMAAMQDYCGELVRTKTAYSRAPFVAYIRSI